MGTTHMVLCLLLVDWPMKSVSSSTLFCRRRKVNAASLGEDRRNTYSGVSAQMRQEQVTSNAQTCLLQIRDVISGVSYTYYMSYQLLQLQLQKQVTPHPQTHLLKILDVTKRCKLQLARGWLRSQYLVMHYRLIAVRATGNGNNTHNFFLGGVNICPPCAFTLIQ